MRETRFFIGREVADVFLADDGFDWDLRGLGGPDRLTGAGGADTLDGGRGDDMLAGGGGDDIFLKGNRDGWDRIDGGDGFDTIVATVPGAILQFSSVTGIERVVGDGAIIAARGDNSYQYRNVLDFSGTELIGIARIQGGGGQDSINGSQRADTILGGAGDDILAGNDGDDRIEGGAGLDQLTGGAGNDTLFGGSGADFIEGGPGDDVIHPGGGLGGGAGDTIVGGDGNDRFVGLRFEFAEASIDLEAREIVELLDVRARPAGGVTLLGDVLVIDADGPGGKPEVAFYVTAPIGESAVFHLVSNGAGGSLVYYDFG